MLLECVESVQRLRNEPHENEINWEHVIYDDGSDDGTQKHFDTTRYPNTRYIRSNENRGIPRAANAAIATCRSDYIFELDSDDIVPQRFLANLYGTTQEYPDTHWFIADFYRMRESKEYVVGDDYYGWKYKNCEEILTAIFSNNHFIQHNVVYKREMWEKVGRYNETTTMAEDLDLYIRFLLAGEMPRYVPFVSHFHRYHVQNASNGVDLEQHERDITQLATKYHMELRAKGIKSIVSSCLPR